LGTPLRNSTLHNTWSVGGLRIAFPVCRRCAGFCAGRVSRQHAHRTRHLRAARMRIAFEHSQR